MKCKSCYILLAVFAVLLTAANGAVRNPVGSGTVVPSSRRSGLIRSPNPIDRSGNLVITGNVGGGKHFRGIVPYNAISDFSGRLGSTAIDPFLRRSAGVEGYGTYTGKLTPFYSQTRTVTTTRPGPIKIFRPPSQRLRSYDAKDLSQATLSRSTALSRRETAISNTGLRPMSRRPKELEKIFANTATTPSQDRTEQQSEAVERQHKEQLEKFRHDLKQVSDKAAELKQSLTGQYESLKPTTPKQPPEDRLESFKLPKVQKPVREEKQPDIYEQMKQQLDEFQKTLEQLPAEKPAKETAKGEKTEEKQDVQKEKSQQEKSSETISAIVRAKSLLGEHKTFASYSDDKFNQHMKIAEDYLKQGKYYRAADAYSLASIYKRNDPLAFAGKSHALFAAGEYMSSSLFLSRALEIFPEYARFKIDIVAMVGDRDKLESRVADVEEWLKSSGAAELEFLLGYVYYQMQRPDRAKDMIEAAYEKMPQSLSVVALKQVIDEYSNTK